MITLQNLLFDTPIWLRAFLIIVGLALLVSGNRRQQQRMKLAGAAVLALCALLCILSYFIDTDQEKVIKRTTNLVHAVDKRDMATVASLLHPDVTLYSWHKTAIVDGAKSLADQNQLTGITINSVEAAQNDPDLIMVSLSATAHTTVPMLEAVPTAWDLRWVRAPEGWLLRDIRVKPAGPGQDGEQLRSRFEQGGP